METIVNQPKQQRQEEEDDLDEFEEDDWDQSKMDKNELFDDRMWIQNWDKEWGKPQDIPQEELEKIRQAGLQIKHS